MWVSMMGSPALREARPAEGLHGDHASIQLPVIESFVEREDRFRNAHRAERQHRAAPAPSVPAMHPFDAAIEQAARAQKFLQTRRGLYRSPR